jgi:hypothetical protein
MIENKTDIKKEKNSHLKRDLLIGSTLLLSPLLGISIYAGFKIKENYDKKKQEKLKNENLLKKSKDEYKSLLNKNNNSIHTNYINNNYYNNEDDDLNIPFTFICPLTKNIMKEPVMTKYGSNYEKIAIENYLKENNKDPLTGNYLTIKMLKPNLKLKNAIDEFLFENKL